MANVHTPIRNTKKSVIIPPSPFLKKLGYGTGVAVYRLERSPQANKIRSPWAVKTANSKKPHTSSEHGKRLKDEAKILRKLKHPNIVGFRAFTTSADKTRMCLAMEECSKSLGDLIETRDENNLGSFPSGNVMKVCADIAKALDYLHNEALLLHCDIKSHNILIQGDFEICKLCDFGVSLPLTKEGNLNESLTNEETEYVGTTPWLAPEVQDYPQVITTKADVFAYGLVIWEMLALRVPLNDSFFDSEDDPDVTAIVKIRERPALPDRDFSEDYVHVLQLFQCCTETDYRQRPTAIDLNIIIEAMLKETA